MKKLISILCAAAMVVSLTACRQQTISLTDHSNTTLTGMVTAVDGTIVALQLGELTDTQMTMPNGQLPSGTGGQMQELPGGGFSDLGTAPDDSAGGEVPELPSGETGGEVPELPGGGMGGEVPELPSGETGGGQSGSGITEMGESVTVFAAGEGTAIIDLSGAKFTVESGEETADGSMEDIAVGHVLEIVVGAKNAVDAVTVKDVSTLGGQMGQMGQMGQPGGNFGGSGEVTQGTSANTIDADGTYTGTTYTSTGDDENALRVDGAAVTLDGITVNKDSGATSNTENGDFYGMNAALLATNGANVTITGITVNSSAQNGNGVFSYGQGTVVNISDSTIVTTADNSGGIQTTGGGTTNASGLEVTTSGSSSAAIRSDRGGGTVNVDGGTYTSNGYNSPAVYSTAAITVKNAVLTANNSEALVIEGKNSMALEHCTVTGSMSDTHGTSSDINVHNVMIYQSMSGDADVGTSVFSMTGGSLTSHNGDMFYVTNTHCILTLSGVDITNHETDGYFLLVSGNDASRGWGSAGSNGAQVEFTADGQTLSGDIAVDSISTLAMELTGSSTFTGTINIIENAQKGAAVEHNAVITIGAGSTWNLTGNCTLTSLDNQGTIHFNGYTITLADGSVLSE